MLSSVLSSELLHNLHRDREREKESQVKFLFVYRPVARHKGVVNSWSVPMNGNKHSKQNMVTLTNKQICALTKTDYGSSLVRLSLSLRAKKINRDMLSSAQKINLDMLSSVLSSEPLYNLQYPSFIDTPLYTGKGIFSLNWPYIGHTKSTWLSSSVVSTQKAVSYTHLTLPTTVPV